jgi:hypothetical protein
MLPTQHWGTTGHNGTVAYILDWNVKRSRFTKQTKRVEFRLKPQALQSALAAAGPAMWRCWQNSETETVGSPLGLYYLCLMPPIFVAAVACFGIAAEAAQPVLRSVTLHTCHSRGHAACYHVPLVTVASGR